MYYAGPQYGTTALHETVEPIERLLDRMTRKSFTESLILAQDERWRRA